MDTEFGFEGTRTVVVGGSSGIGYATAARIVDEGGEVVVAARGDEERAAAADRLGDRATERRVDLADPGSVADALAAVGDLDYLVCTAAYLPSGFDVSDEDLRRAFEVKLLGYRRAAAAARERLPDDGAIAFVTGEASRRPAPDFFAAGVVNAAVESLVRYLAVEYAPIRVSAVSPNVVDTFGMDEATREAVAGRVPVGRVAEPEDVADALAFALRNRNATGETFRVNGGAGLV
jgi:NAD(P)-dependent dehydrogenase (short-subunit alcohol dehydrogenase family)